MLYLECAICASLLTMIAVSMWGAISRTAIPPRQGINQLVHDAIVVGALVAFAFIVMLESF